jgi:LAS superfamily LD-carboxypeptidase LdcB
MALLTDMDLAALGQSEAHLCDLAMVAGLGAPMHRDVVAPFLALRAQAREVGFDLRVLSGFRGFERQLSIWNRKVSGELALLDSEARPLDVTTMSDVEIVFAILRWSALPGASRHHWGTDLDIYDAAASPPGYQVELVPAEVDDAGMFGPMHRWLDRRIGTGLAQGFFRPYDKDRGGVAPERWHLSHAPTAAMYQHRITPDLLREVLGQAELRLRETVLDHLDEIFDRFVTNVNQGPA